MNIRVSLTSVFFILMFLIASCSKNDTKSFQAVNTKFSGRIDLNNLANYANQKKPAYITRDNIGSNIISDAKATIGRVLFYDKIGRAHV